MKYVLTVESWTVWGTQPDGSVVMVADLHRGFGKQVDAFDANGALIGTFSSTSSAKRAAIRRYEDRSGRLPRADLESGDPA